MSTTAIPTGRPLQDQTLLRLGATRLTLLHVDFALIVLWFAVTPAKFKYDELLLYPMALYFAFAFFRDRSATWPVFKRGAVLLLLPAWWLLSAVWSPETALALRSGVQIILTILICMYIASRLTVDQFLIVLLVALSVTALRSLPQALFDLSVGAPSKAIYNHKNSLGNDMAVLSAVAIATVLTPTISSILRQCALAMLPIALLLVFASQSATAILISFGMGGVILGALFFLGRRNLINFGRLAVICLAVGAIAVGLSMAINLMETDPITLVLEARGKDRSLTGRTELWAIAADEIAERPLFGTGAYGYWRYDEYSAVRQIFIDFYKERGNLFHFHNSWLEISVNLGFIGAVLSALAMIWALSVLTWRALTNGGPQLWALLAIALAVFTRTMTEADLFKQFVMLQMVLWTGALIASGLGSRPKQN